MIRASFSIVQSTTDGPIIAAVPNKAVRVLAIVMSTPTATPITFNSKPAGAGTAISPAVNLGANAPFVLPPLNMPEGTGPAGWWDTNSGEGLTATTGAGGTVTGEVIYDTV